MTFEDEVVDREVLDLKKFHNTKLANVNDAEVFDNLVEEMFVFLKHRFVIIDETKIKMDLKNYMMNMTIKDYITQDWRFPINFATSKQLPPKRPERERFETRQGHEMICEIVMTEEDGIWKIKKFQMIAISRW